ncbi:HTH-type transcriptional regulator BhcR [Nitratireductor sp. StC3]|uniref:HTH-type transcriptional regulator BhcR n=1 Tax=Nitratireductor sp. StC3 TaxID=2126741 RepID=UPI000D0DA061|nr:HTH-type transcriptional regulator BhcR [Nitratireductor sp. StC3]PSM16782.1 IclR family transcriptional regulator [Nitratireductor sp. StC3]
METDDRIKRSRGRPRAFNRTQQGGSVQSLDRAVAILKRVADANGLSLSEIASAMGQAPSTVYRVLITLQKHGIVEFEQDTQLWFVGLEAFRIGSTFLGRTSLVEQSRPVMQELMAATGETANLAIIDGGEVIFVSQVETHEPIRAFFRPGTRGPVHASGIGKALLAFLPPNRVERIIRDNGLTAFTDQTVADPARLGREIAAIRARGWAVDDEERTAGMRCIAAPVFNAYGEAVAGISISGPSVRVAPDKDAWHGALVRDAAARITDAVGGRPPRPVED